MNKLITVAVRKAAMSKTILPKNRDNARRILRKDIWKDS